MLPEGRCALKRELGIVITVLASRLQNTPPGTLNRFRNKVVKTLPAQVVTGRRVQADIVSERAGGWSPCSFAHKPISALLHEGQLLHHLFHEDEENRSRFLIGKQIGRLCLTGEKEDPVALAEQLGVVLLNDDDNFSPFAFVS